MEKRIPIDGVFLCEGKYDKGKLESIFDTTVITTGGFHIYGDDEKMKFIEALSQNKPIYILTDSDWAGFQIRAFLKNKLRQAEVHHIYIPDIYGKEKRKNAPSKEGKLGVEGIERDLLVKAVLQVVNPSVVDPTQEKLTNLDFYRLGLTGAADSGERRRLAQKKLNVPANLSAKAFLEVLNLLYNKEEALKLLEKYLGGDKK